MKSQTLPTITITKVLALSLLIGTGCATDVDLATAAHEVAGQPILLPSSGTGQSREVMSTFDPLMVTLYDTYGAPMADQTITFTTPVAGATSTFRFGGDVATDANGLAEIRPYANSIAGTYIVWAHAEGAVPMPFVLTNTAASPAVLEPVLGTNQGTMVGLPFPYPLTVEVRDNYGNVVEGAPVHFTAPADGPSTSMTGDGYTITDDEGRAAVFATAGTDAGTYTVVASVAGAPSAVFTLSNTTHQVFPTGEQLTDLHLETATRSREP